MSEYKLSENNWTRVAVFAGGDRGHYRTDFDSFVGVDRGSLWVLEENLPLALAVGDFDSVTAEERQVIQKRAQHFVQARPEKDDTDLELALLTIFEKNPQAQVTILVLWVAVLTICWPMSFYLAIPSWLPICVR